MLLTYNIFFVFLSGLGTSETLWLVCKHPNVSVCLYIVLSELLLILFNRCSRC